MNKPNLPSNFGSPGGPRFLDVLNFHLGTKLQQYVGRVLDQQTMAEMFECVRETVHGVFSHSSQNIASEAREWLSQRLYECIKIGDNQIITREEDTWKHSVTPMYERANLARVSDSDIRLLAGLFSEASFSGDIRDELRRRGF